ncbi:MAG: hypothetical protein Q9198_002283 [Flavoplaca austrocitrina]
MDVVYISPRSEDTEVFESVIQHPTFRTAIKHVVYDTATVVFYDLEDYFDALMLQLDQKEYNGMRNKNHVMKKRMKLKAKRSYYKSKQIFKMFKNNLKCMEDYHQYYLVALGEAEMDTKDEDHHDTSDGDEDNENKDENDEWEDWNSSDTDTYSPLADAPGLRMDGTHLVGSPPARAWRPTWLNPPYRTKHFHDRENVCSVYWEEWHNVQHDFALIVQMLKKARIQPKAFRVPGNKNESQSLSAQLLKCLDAHKSFDEPFLYLAGHLQELHLSIASYDQTPAQRLVPELSLLRAFLKGAKSLVSLSLILSTENNINSEEIVLYKSSNVFPTLVELELHGLSALSIVGLRISYSDLVGLLFLKLPNLESLSLSYIELVEGGIMENVVEGLRQRKHMKKCVLKSPLSDGHP